MNFSVPQARVLLAVLLLGVCLCLHAGQGPDAVPGISVCYDYGCKRTARVSLTAAEWKELMDVVTSAAASAAQERQQLGQAIALMERLVGRHAPTWRDLGKNPSTDDWPGQMDCIDESINTTRYLQLFASHGGLRWHRVSGRVARAPWLFDNHWAGQLVELATQRRYAVDSWHLDNGALPVIQPLDDWRRKRHYGEAATGTIEDE